METLLIVFAILLFLVGLAGVLIPMLPGIPLCWGGLLLLKLTERAGGQISWRAIIIWGIVTIVVTILDNVLPIWGTRKAGGSKFVVVCATVGLLFGLFAGPVGIFLGPFIGALIGALIEGNQPGQSTQQAAGAFLGLLVGIAIKFCCAGLMLWQFIRALW